MNDYQRSLWVSAAVGCHWSHSKANAAISTYACGAERGYTAYYERREVGNYATFERAALAVNNAIALDYGLSA